MEIKLSLAELNMINMALSYLKSNISDAEELFEENISEMYLEQLQSYINQLKSEGVK